MGGTIFLMWLGEQITARGVGNGISLIIFAGIVANLPHALVSTLELGRTGAISPIAIFVLFIMAVGLIGFLFLTQRRHPRLPLQYPQRPPGHHMFCCAPPHFAFKL